MGIITMLCSLFGCSAQTEGFKSLTVKEYAKAIEDTAIVRLDVRTAEEFAEGHIAKTLNIDVLKNDFESKAVAMLPKDHTIAVNCRSGKRSKNAARILVKNGFKVIELDGGYNDWVKNRMPVTK
ncbi:rhodanese-like domain-containing protein [Prevotella sp.]|nr:rhodanese-like domain-containing protein [Prevotella sp.]